LSFFDEGDDPRTAIRSAKPPPRRPAAGARRGSTDDRTLLLRRGGAAGLVLLVIIGLVFGVKAVLNHQALQGLRSYSTELNQLVAEEKTNVRDAFFPDIVDSFSNPNPAGVPETLQQLISVEHTYYTQAQSWSVPSQMVAAQRDYVLALGLRYQALQTIQGQMSLALGGGGGQVQAIKLIAGAMETLLTSDGIYAQRVAPLVDEALAKAGVTGLSTDPSVFLPDVQWLIPATVAQRVLGFVPLGFPGGIPTGGSPGHELVSVTVPSEGILQSGTSSFTKIPYTSAGITFVLTILDSGNVQVPDVMSDISFFKAGESTSCLTTQAPPIRLSKPGATYMSSIVFAGGTCSNVSQFYNQVLQMTATVQPVPGETDKSNNSMKFYVEFTHP
jgi:hypothetical protein